MKYSVIFETEAEFAEFLEWRAGRQQSQAIRDWANCEIASASDLTIRTKHLLSMAGISTFEDLRLSRDADLLKLDGFGRMALVECKRALKVRSGAGEKT